MSFQVLVQQLGELFRVVEVGAGGDMVASSELTKLAPTLPPVQLVDGQLPDREGPAWANGSADAPVWHSSVECVRPDGNSTKGSGE